MESICLRNCVCKAASRSEEGVNTCWEGRKKERREERKERGGEGEKKKAEEGRKGENQRLVGMSGSEDREL